MERRALFNSLRMNWLNEPSLKVQAWQVEDLRKETGENLFKRLQNFGLDIDKITFIAFAEDVDTPEDFAESLLQEESFSPEEEDQIYLLVFEIWRRLVNEKPSLSIFCDELDHQIFAYDTKSAANEEALEGAIANLETILDANTDEGKDPVAVLETIANYCANDLETFFYDYIADNIDTQEMTYAGEILDSFIDYFKDQTWFSFLQARILSHTDPKQADELLKKLIKEVKKEGDLDLSLEMLNFLANGADKELFRLLLVQTVHILETEEDFQEILKITADYYHFLDQEKEEKQILELFKARNSIPDERIISPKDPAVLQFIKMVK